MRAYQLARGGLAGCAGVLFAAVATAQAPPICTFDTAAHMVTDSVILGLAPGWRVNRGKAIPPDYLTAAQAIQTHFQPPNQVRLPLWARTIAARSSAPDTSEYVGHGLDGHIRFRITDTGHLTDDRIVEVGTASPDIAASIIAAVHRADSAGAFAPPTRDVRKDKGAIILRFVDAPHTQGPSVALLRITIPAVIIDSAPEMLSMPRLRYPQGALRARAMDRVIVQFVVGADGRPDTSTVELVQAQYQEFALTTLRAIKDSRFRPASIAGCPVPTIVRVPIDFRLRY